MTSIGPIKQRGSNKPNVWSTGWRRAEPNPNVLACGIRKWGGNQRAHYVLSLGNRVGEDADSLNLTLDQIPRVYNADSSRGTGQDDISWK